MIVPSPDQNRTRPPAGEEVRNISLECGTTAPLSANEILTAKLPVSGRKKSQQYLVVIASAVEEIIREWIDKQIPVTSDRSLTFDKFHTTPSEWRTHSQELDLVAATAHEPEFIAEIKMTRAKHCDHGARQVKPKRDTLRGVYPGVGAIAVAISFPKVGKVNSKNLLRTPLRLNLDAIRTQLARDQIPQVIIPRRDFLKIADMCGVRIQPHIDKIYGRDHRQPRRKK